jgi:putative transposase
MKNHIHLIIYVEKAKDLPKFMQAVLQTYGAYFRKSYGCVGFVFQNRYKSHLIDKDTYLLECARYIERNPLRTKLVDSLFSYPWSSFLFYAKGINDKIVNKVNLFYPELGQTPQARQQCYQNYILEERPYEHIIDKSRIFLPKSYATL